jgi:hypothetical protein
MLFLLAAAHATPPGPVLIGLAIEPRDDAPIDARILVRATFAPETLVTEGPELDVVLPSEVVVAYSMNEPLVAVLPPEGGWAPNAERTVVVLADPYGESAMGETLTFSTGASGAADPIDPEVLDVEVSEWSDDTEYGWGCCAPTRTVTVTVTNPSADPWSYVELLGDFPGPSQLTTSPDLRRLDAGIGPGEHAISYLQWFQDGELHPFAFSVAAVEADGDRSAEVPVDAPGDLPADPEEPTEGSAACGCSSGGSGAWTLALALLAARRRQGRKM